MAVLTRYPVSEPPTAPVREATGHLALRAWCVLALLATFAAPAWVLAIGPAGAAGVAAVLAAVSAVWWISAPPPLQWTRLPWYPFAFALWLSLSLWWSTPSAADALATATLVLGTVPALFVGAALSWRELVRALAGALKWVLGLSLVLELAVTWFLASPLVAPAGGATVSSGAFFDLDERMTGVVGDADLLGILAVLALVVFAVRFASRPPRRPLLAVWLVVAAAVLVRTNSAIAWCGVGLVAVALGAILLRRAVRRSAERSRLYVVFAAVAAVAGAALWMARDAIAALTATVTDPAGALLGTDRPVSGWILERAGVVGLVLLSLVALALLWRGWFFAVDRPRWDLTADRAYSPVSMLPSLTAALLLVAGSVQTTTLVAGGWLLVVAFESKIRQSPVVGVGPAEERDALERGESPRSAADTEPPPPGGTTAARG